MDKGTEPKRVGIKKSQNSLPSKKSGRGLRPNLLFVIIGIFLVGLFGAILYFFRGDIMKLVPGFYQNHTYNDLTVKKNDLIDENSTLLSQNEQKENEITNLGVTVEDYTTRVNSYTTIVNNLTKVQKNLDTITGYDKTFVKLRLPIAVVEYVKILADLDEVRSEEVGISMKVATGRKEFAEFNKTRAEFDKCLSDINWAWSDSNISSAIKKCNGKITTLKTQISDIEKKYGVTLDKITKYLKLLGEEWTAEASYYSSLAARNYSQANANDAVFASRKRSINAMDLVDVFNEFQTEYLGPQLEKFVEKSEHEKELETSADNWYQNNLKK